MATQPQQRIYIGIYYIESSLRDTPTLMHFFHGLTPRAAQPGCVGGTMSPHFCDQRGIGGTGQSIEHDISFYSRQSLFSTVQVTEFQLPRL